MVYLQNIYIIRKARAAPRGLLGHRQFGRLVRERGEKQTAVSDSPVSERACFPAGGFGESRGRLVSLCVCLDVNAEVKNTSECFSVVGSKCCIPYQLRILKSNKFFKNGELVLTMNDYKPLYVFKLAKANFRPI